MLTLLGILVLCAIVLAPRVRLFRGRHERQFGYMSERWLAEHRASEQT